MRAPASPSSRPLATPPPGTNPARAVSPPVQPPGQSDHSTGGPPPCCRGSRCVRAGTSASDPRGSRSRPLGRKKKIESRIFFFLPPPQWGGLDLDSRSSGCARLGGGVGPPLGVEFSSCKKIHRPKMGYPFCTPRCSRPSSGISIVQHPLTPFSWRSFSYTARFCVTRHRIYEQLPSKDC